MDNRQAGRGGRADRITHIFAFFSHRNRWEFNMTGTYKDLIGLIERLHRRCLDVIKVEIDRQEIKNLNPVQAMILFNIGDRELMMGQLVEQGYYLGSNVSYNIKKMVENGYVVQTRSIYDRRSMNARSSERGREVCAHIEELFGCHASQLSEHMRMDEDLIHTREALLKLEHLWSSGRHISAQR